MQLTALRSTRRQERISWHGACLSCFKVRFRVHTLRAPNHMREVGLSDLFDARGQAQGHFKEGVVVQAPPRALHMNVSS